MSVFTDTDTFNLDFLDLIEVRVSAYNIKGWGETSEPNTVGEYVRVPPFYMNNPVRGSETNDKQLFVSWDALSSDISVTGGSSILSYGLEWDDGTNQVSWYPITGFSSDSLDTEFVI
jgi:hypothetical protein